MDQFAKDAFDGAGETNDASILQFSFTPEDDVQSVSLDLVFASEEYIEYSNSSFVDIGAVWFEGQDDTQNYASFDPSADKPLSIVTNSTDDPRFINNDKWDNLNNEAVPYTELATEFDGITQSLKITAPLENVTPNSDGSYTINIGIADTGDYILDSSIWVSNLQGNLFDSSGILAIETVETDTTYVAPTDYPVYLSLNPGSTAVMGEQPDIAELPEDGGEGATISGTVEQLSGDTILNYDETSVVEVNDASLTPSSFKAELISTSSSTELNKLQYSPVLPAHHRHRHASSSFLLC